MRRTAALALTAALAVAARPSAQAPAQIPDVSPKAVSAAAARYVAAYQRQLQYVVADEDATQVVTGPAGATERRRTRADLFVTWLPDDGAWMSVRDVREVDGEPVAPNPADDLGRLLAGGGLGRLGAVIAEKNARYNIGTVTRTFNEPTLALLVFNERHLPRFRFGRKRVTAGAGGPLVTLTFQEKDAPTLIRGMGTGDVFTKGELVVDVATGRVERTVIEMRVRAIAARIETTYAHDAKLDLWVPSAMRETYEQAGRQRIDVDSTYRNYRRYETTSRIK